jgi:transposase
MQIHSVGIDLGKTTFHLVALGAAGKVLVRKKFTQKQLLLFTANLQTSLIGLEACSGAHFLGRALRKQGHDVRLIPAQFVKPFVKSNKNDFIDAEAIAEAVERKNMRFVPIKTDDQLDLQAIHRVSGSADFEAHSGHQPAACFSAGAWDGVCQDTGEAPSCDGGCPGERGR